MHCSECKCNPGISNFIICPLFFFQKINSFGEKDEGLLNCMSSFVCMRTPSLYRVNYSDYSWVIGEILGLFFRVVTQKAMLNRQITTASSTVRRICSSSNSEDFSDDNYGASFY